MTLAIVYLRRHCSATLQLSADIPSLAPERIPIASCLGGGELVGTWDRSDRVYVSREPLSPKCGSLGQSRWGTEALTPATVVAAGSQEAVPASLRTEAGFAGRISSPSSARTNPSHASKRSSIKT